MTMAMAHRRSLGPLLSRLALGILCLGWLSGLTAGPSAAAGDDDNFFTHIHTEKAMANVTVSPGRAGPVDIAIQLETMEEKPLTARAVSVTLSDAKAGKRLQAVQAEHSFDDSWHVRIPNLAAGRWMLGLGISIADSDTFSVESPILIK
jgi:copper transport protein